MAKLVEIAANRDDLKMLMTLVEAAGVLELLESEGSYTVFAPTDEAFAKISANTIASLMEDILALKKIVTYHIVFGDVRLEDLEEIDEAPTVEGSVLAIDKSEGLKVNDAKILKTDILADNGVIHIVDSVLMPAVVAV